MSDLTRKRKKAARRAVSISRVMALTFLGIILFGAALLNLPAASRDGRPAGAMVSLFTATSATCVTGLTLADTWTQWSGFGQTVILLMIQIGGLGFMSAASLAYFSLRRKVSIQQQMVMAEAIGVQNMGDVVIHQKRLLIRAFAVEGAGAALLTARFLAEYPLPQAVKLGIFHAVSAFCNAGFDILGFRAPGGSLITYREDPAVCLILAMLVILGGLGFLVWDEVLRERHPSKWSVYTRLVLITSGILLAAGMAATCLLEWNNPATLGPMPAGKKLLAGFFQSVTLRTAGFAALDQGSLTPAGKGLSLFLMLIGGSSGSTAGGLKTVTSVVLAMFVWSRMRGRRTVSVFHRTISDDHVMNALQIFILMITLAFFSAIVISGTSPLDFTDALFESVSAIGTVGLTAGGTARMSPAAKILIMLLMYFGRVGVLTISMGFLKKKPAGEKYRYANTELLIG
ncbi:MAG: potassium uptake protein, TrkH family [Clostridia bacterium]|nr:potassium uptake protein, TrkH family [Clostridia bacterium]